MKINIGCGHDYRKDWKNIDISNEVKADEYYDIRDGIKEEDNSCDEIYCSGVLEQVLENEKFLFVMNEFWRVLYMSGVLTVIVPTARHHNAFRDPFDCRRFIEETWNYLDCQSIYFSLYGSVYGFKPWDIISLETNNKGIMTVKLKPKK